MVKPPYLPMLLKVDRMPKSNLNSITKIKGHVAVEWALVTFLMTVVMFAPLPGSQQSLVGLVMQAIREFYLNLSLLVSLP